MNPWLAFGIGCFIGFWFGFFWYSAFKLGADSDRLREEIFRKLRKENGE